MNDLLPVGVGDGLGDLPEDLQANVRRKSVLPLGEEVIEPLGSFLPAEDQCGPELGLGQGIHALDSGVVEAFQDLKLPLGGPTKDGALLVSLQALHVDPDEPGTGLGPHVLSQPLLIRLPGAVVEQLVEEVVAGFAGLFDGLKADILDGGGKRTDLVRRNRWPSIRLQARRFPPRDGADDARDRSILLVADTDADRVGAVEVENVAVVGAENEGLDPGRLRLAASPEGAPMAQERFQCLALAIGEGQWVVTGLVVGAVPPRPGPTLAGDRSGNALDLDEEGAPGADNEEIDFVNGSRFGPELEVRPGLER